MTWRTAWAVITSRPAIAIAAGCFAAWLALEYGNHWRRAAAIAEPVTLDTVGRAQDWPVAPLPECPAIAELKPPAKERKRLEQRFGVTLGGNGATVAVNAPIPAAAGSPMFPLSAPALSAETRILAYKTVPPAPRGGEVLATLRPGDPQIALDFRANPRPFIEFGADYGMGVEGALMGSESAQRWRAYGFLEPVRIGRFTLRALAGGEMRDAETGWFVGAALEFRP